MICPKNYFYERVKEKNFLESQIFRNPFFQGIWMVKPDCFLENSRLCIDDTLPVVRVLLALMAGITRDISVYYLQLACME